MRIEFLYKLRHHCLVITKKSAPASGRVKYISTLSLGEQNVTEASNRLLLLLGIYSFH